MNHFTAHTRRREAIERIETALKTIRSGGMIVVRDDESRENEGDIVCAAEHATEANVAFMAVHGRGLICQSISAADAVRLGLPPMTRDNTEAQRTAFTVSVDAARGITTGISAADRARAIATLVNPRSRPDDLVRPGHLFPLVAVAGGVLARRGHTEASLDLARLAGCKPSGVICEIMSDDGTMARGAQLEGFARRHALPLVSIEDLIVYRDATGDVSIEVSSAARMPTEFGEFTATMYRTEDPACAEVVLLRAPETTDRVASSGPGRTPAEAPAPGQPAPLVRLHSECLTGEAFGSLRCDCGPQLREALRRIAQEGGALVYLRQEGRGIGLFEKIRAYTLQDQGYDTVDANLELGHPAEARRFGAAAAVLRAAGFHRVRLLTNNPAKLATLVDAGIEVAERVPWMVGRGTHNEHYLNTKVLRMGHLAG